MTPERECVVKAEQTMDLLLQDLRALQAKTENTALEILTLAAIEDVAKWHTRFKWLLSKGNNNEPSA